ncbi:tetraspanin-6-like [Lytechinus variegatus]|uniref:tetraspanin-6-like n=1 Tax=Lytechinus variegatus TaxID=7654 RepID=UPI001BB286FD|nr:tetraspanin-6-like [Lytechinus variegatus]XP_041471579.1 tetraspanin-6-like [Lytechinus variegatus]
MSTTPCGTFAKIVLFVVNFVFWLTGVAVLGIGIWVSVDRGTADFLPLFEDPLFKILGYSMIGIGGFVTLLGFIGCFGACHEHKWMVWLYFLIVLLLLLAEVVSTSLLFAFRSQVESFVNSKLDSTIKTQYGEENRDGTTEAIDAMQRMLMCCGNHNFTDWEDSDWYLKENPDNMTQTILYVPQSCCIADGDKLRNRAVCQESPEDVNPERHSEGCFNALYAKLLDYIWVVGGIGIGVAVLQVLLLILAVVLLRNVIDDDDYED